jgi:hyperosmotically inducible periplasmic protein
MNLTRAFNFLLIIVLFGAILAMNACSKTDANGETVGQKVDKAIDRTTAAVDDASSKIAAGATEAGTALRDTGKKIEDSANQAASQGTDRAEQARSVVDDSLITASIKADLLKDPGLSAFRVDVTTLKGEVTLNGDVDTEAAKDRAGRLALAISGVAKVNNLLTVSSKSAQRPGVRNASEQEEQFTLTPARMRMMT